MKSLPEKFPIRYAIIVSEDFNDKKIKDDFDKSERNTLWCQFIDYIKKNPLTLDDLSINYVSAEYVTNNGNKICVLPKLKGNSKWQEQIYEILYKNIPLTIFSPSSGRAFNLSLYSYSGMLETPIFWKVAHGLKPDEVIENLQLRALGQYSLSGLDYSMDINFKRIMNGELDSWENQNNLKEPLVFYVRVPYSRLWKALDTSVNNGVVSYQNDVSLIKSEVGKVEEVEENEFITIVVAKNLLALMYEEMVSVYKASSFCNSCNKPLPFGYKGKFCPNSQENKACNQKRARIRKRRSGSQIK